MIYFVQPQGRPFVKIGYACHVGNRLYHLQIANPDELILVGVIPGGLARESTIHDKFAHLCIRGERFRYTKEIRRFIRVNAIAYDPELHDPRPKNPAEEEAWKASLAAVNPARQDKRIIVCVTRMHDRDNLVLQWHHPKTGYRKSKSARSTNADEAERRRADLESALNKEIDPLRNGSRNTPRGEAQTVERMDAANGELDSTFGLS